MMTDGAYHDDWLDPNDDENVREFEFSTEAEAREFLAKAADEANSNSGIESYAASVYEVGPRGGRKMLF